MQVSNGILKLKYDEPNPEPTMRLGRNLELDARSLPFMVSEAAAAVAIKPAKHEITIPLLDQGNLGSCTGNGGTYAMSVAYAGSFALAGLKGLTLSPTDADNNERFAVELYHQATVKDGFPGTYPPDDTGSSGLGVCKALKSDGLISRYHFAGSVRGLATLLQTNGIMLGVPWYQAWFNPDHDGFIDADPKWQASGVAGGHEIFGEALEAWDDHDPSKCIIRGPNSWGASWGDAGHWRMRLSTYLALKSQIDVKQLVR